MTAISVYAGSALLWAQQAVGVFEGGELRPLRLYDYQARLLSDRSPRQLCLKARQVGISFAAALRVAHLALFRPRSVILIVSRDQNTAGAFIQGVYDVLDSLDSPPEFRRRAVQECELANGSRIISQASTRRAGRGFRADLVVLDEFGFAEYDAAILRAVSPTLSRGGALMIISTPNGTANMFYRLYQGEEGGDWSRHRIHWRDCPAYSQEWYDLQRPRYTAQDWASEFECSFVESGDAPFSLDDIERMPDGWLGEQGASAGHAYVTAWDIGRRRDPTVGMTIDVTPAAWQVVAYQRLLGAPFEQSAAAIVERASRYGGMNIIESNSFGLAVVELVEGQGVPVVQFTTGAASKALALTRLIRQIEQQRLKCGIEQVLSELRSYQWRDEGLVQDCVITLAMATWGAVEWLSQPEQQTLYFAPGMLEFGWSGWTRNPQAAAKFGRVRIGARGLDDYMRGGGDWDEPVRIGPV